MDNFDKWCVNDIPQMVQKLSNKKKTGTVRWVTDTGVKRMLSLVCYVAAMKWYLLTLHYKIALNTLY